MSAPEPFPCKICRAPTAPAGSKRGVLTETMFMLRHCGSCGFGFVENPWLDFARIYDERYYRGAGADPLVDYLFELEHPQETIRRAEWQGILEAVNRLKPLGPGSKLLDFGCGNGGFVRHCNSTSACEAVGFETGWIASEARARGIPILEEEQLASRAGAFDVVTAIEVFEHVIDPASALQAVRRLLKPGGLLFLTTGNAAAHRDLVKWGYVLPEVHVSFYEPRSLELALAAAGFRSERRGFVPGWEKIIRFKVLKQLGLRRHSALHDALPWKLLSRIVDRRMAVTAHPIGWAI